MYGNRVICAMARETCVFNQVITQRRNQENGIKSDMLKHSVEVL